MKKQGHYETNFYTYSRLLVEYRRYAMNSILFLGKNPMSRISWLTLKILANIFAHVKNFDVICKKIEWILNNSMHI